jgi:two-component system CheB/CheR fusion protein
MDTARILLLEHNPADSKPTTEAPTECGRPVVANNGAGYGATLSLELAAAASEPAATITKRPMNTMNNQRDSGRLRILIVDDHDDTRRVIQMLLERRGYSTLTATSVQAALDVAEANDFDLLISDIGLPDGTGVDLIRALIGDGKSVKAIALSGYGMEEDIRRSKDAGFFEHLTKPVSIKRLQDVIDELVGRKF